MDKVKALIIDDEPSAVNTLSLMIRHYLPGITELRSTNDPHEGLFLLKSCQPQLLFLDIQMPLMSGMELLKQVPGITCNIIFTTAHDEYAIDAIRFSALDYLLKPIDADELQNAYARFVQKQNSGTQNLPLYKNFIHNINVQDQKDFKLALSTTEGTFFYIPSSIIRLEGESNYTRFHFEDKTTLLTSRTLKEYEEILTRHGFLRVHKSHLINKTHVINYTADGLLTMTDLSKVEISRRRKEEVMESLRSF